MRAGSIGFKSTTVSLTETLIGMINKTRVSLCYAISTGVACGLSMNFNQLR
jgi:hypothetical protein